MAGKMDSQRLAKPRKPQRLVTVESTRYLTPHLIRVTLSGAALADFPENAEGGYIKLALNNNGKDCVRSYTVVAFDRNCRTLVFDLVAHGDKGPASRWASNVVPGQAVTIVGPGAVKRINQQADWFLLAGDMTALPAISVNLRCLPDSARGYVVLEVIDESDTCIDLQIPENIKVSWLINPAPEAASSKLADTVAALPWLPGQVGAWVAGEFSSSRAIRHYLKHQRLVGKDFMYLSCYWKLGATDEGMKAAKRADVEAW